MQDFYLTIYTKIQYLPYIFPNLYLNLVNLQTQTMLIHSDEVSDGVSKYMNSRGRFKTLNARREDYGRRQEKKEDETSKKKTNSPAKSCAPNVKIPRFRGSKLFSVTRRRMDAGGTGDRCTRAVLGERRRAAVKCSYATRNWWCTRDALPIEGKNVRVSRRTSPSSCRRSLVHPLHCPRTAPRTVQARLRSLRFAESRVRATSAALALKSPCGDRLGDLAGASFRRGFLAFKSLIGRDRARGSLIAVS
ncbi:hypothetical protein ALC60_07548 [Trachymyrmex zeteki]|uniref:Uncharacterized protein n=1 Tax=Mycetomoellerius zeteki TaxID=64791 RepID=A0A151WZI4_9HYME|nr:hypothetical protein ALC60_07548 [Trachymyrmex zeteki]